MHGGLKRESPPRMGPSHEETGQNLLLSTHADTGGSPCDRCSSATTTFQSSQATSKGGARIRPLRPLLLLHGRLALVTRGGDRDDAEGTQTIAVVSKSHRHG